MKHLAFLIFVASLAAISWVTTVPTIAAQGSGTTGTGGSVCVILKRMGPADQVTSHLYSFGIRGKQFN
jgi:hypothetical protein